MILYIYLVFSIIDPLSNFYLPSKRKWIEMDRNGFILFVSNPDSDLLNPFLPN